MTVTMETAVATIIHTNTPRIGLKEKIYLHRRHRLVLRLDPTHELVDTRVDVITTPVVDGLLQQWDPTREFAGHVVVDDQRAALLVEQLVRGTLSAVQKPPYV